MILDVKELNGDIVSNIDDAMVFLKKHLRLSYRIETLQRKNILELPEDALREAIVNAVCHRDYFEKGARVMVEIFEDRVDIVSPGGVCKGITDENFGMVSITRNSIVAGVLHRIGYIEQMGTGIIRMKNAAKEANVAEPEFEFSGFFKVTFKRNATHSAVTIYTQSKLNRNSIETQSKLSDKKSAIITYLDTHEKLTARDIAALFGITGSWARNLLRQMASDGTIEKIGNYRFTYYILKR